MSERCRSTIDRVFDHGKVAFGACGGASRWLLVDDGRSLLSIWWMLLLLFALVERSTWHAIGHCGRIPRLAWKKPSRRQPIYLARAGRWIKIVLFFWERWPGRGSRRGFTSFALKVKASFKVLLWYHSRTLSERSVFILEECGGGGGGGGGKRKGPQTTFWKSLCFKTKQKKSLKGRDRYKDGTPTKKGALGTN